MLYILGALALWMFDILAAGLLHQQIIYSTYIGYITTLLIGATMPHIALSALLAVSIVLLFHGKLSALPLLLLLFYPILITWLKKYSRPTKVAYTIIITILLTLFVYAIGDAWTPLKFFANILSTVVLLRWYAPKVGRVIA